MPMKLTLHLRYKGRDKKEKHQFSNLRRLVDGSPINKEKRVRFGALGGKDASSFGFINYIGDKSSM